MIPEPALQPCNDERTARPGLPPELPSKWSWATLGKVALFINGDRGANYPKQSDYVGNGVAFVNTGHIEPSGRLALERMQYISRASFDRLRSGKLMQGDIVYCLRGSTIGKTARVDFAEGAIASSLVIIRSKADISQDFLYYFLAGPFGQRFVKQLDNGSAQPNLSVAAISKYPVPLPPLSEQRAIASILGALDDKIELSRRMNETLEALARALFQDWFADATQDDLPEGWRMGKLRDCCERVENGGTPSRNVPDYWQPQEVPWLTSGEVRQKIVAATENFISRAGLENSSAKLWQKETTVVALYGATAGQVTLLGSEMCSNQACCALIPKPGWRFYVYLHTSSSIQALEQQVRGSAQQNLSQQIVADLPTLLPDEHTIAKFDSVVAPFIERWICNLFESCTLAALRDALLPKLLSGELRVPAAAKLAEARA